jgi:hypothetical protein
MKAECPQCGKHVALAQCPDKGAVMTCSACGKRFEPATCLKFEFGQIHITEEEETFVVEWQIRT